MMMKVFLLCIVLAVAAAYGGYNDRDRDDDRPDRYESRDRFDRDDDYRDGDYRDRDYGDRDYRYGVPRGSRPSPSCSRRCGPGQRCEQKRRCSYSGCRFEAQCVTVATATVKKGSCPNRDPNRAGTYCRDDCQRDDDCNGDQKCCRGVYCSGAKCYTPQVDPCAYKLCPSNYVCVVKRRQGCSYCRKEATCVFRRPTRRINNVRRPKYYRG